MNVKRSLYYRARAFVTRAEKKQIARDFPPGAVAPISLDLLRLFQSINAFDPRFDCLVDVGAHKGLFARCANLFFEIQHTICIEPHAAMIPTIRENTRAFNVTILQKAVSDRAGVVDFYVHEDDTMNSIVRADPAVLAEKFPWDNPDALSSTTVQALTLDQGVAEASLDPKSRLFLKLDTQGNELDILRAGTDSLRRAEACLVEHMFLSPYESTYTFADLIAFMEAQGFACKGPLSISKRPSHEISGVDFYFQRNR